MDASELQLGSRNSEEGVQGSLGVLGFGGLDSIFRPWGLESLKAQGLFRSGALLAKNGVGESTTFMYFTTP